MRFIRYYYGLFQFRELKSLGDCWKLRILCNGRAFGEAYFFGYFNLMMLRLLLYFWLVMDFHDS